VEELPVALLPPCSLFLAGLHRGGAACSPSPASRPVVVVEEAAVLREGRRLGEAEQTAEPGGRAEAHREAVAGPLRFTAVGKVGWYLLKQFKNSEGVSLCNVAVSPFSISCHVNASCCSLN